MLKELKSELQKCNSTRDVNRILKKNNIRGVFVRTAKRTAEEPRKSWELLIYSPTDYEYKVIYKGNLKSCVYALLAY